MCMVGGVRQKMGKKRICQEVVFENTANYSEDEMEMGGGHVMT